MDPRRATLAFLLAVPAALGFTLVWYGIVRGRGGAIVVGLVLLLLPFLALRRINGR